MRIWLNLAVIALFFCSLFQPVLPVYKYLLNYDYIVNVLCINKEKPELQCNGKCYLKKELSASKITSDQNPEELLNYRFKPVPLYFEDFKGFQQFDILEEKRTLIFCRSTDFKNHFTKPILPPPRL